MRCNQDTASHIVKWGTLTPKGPRLEKVQTHHLLHQSSNDHLVSTESKRITSSRSRIASLQWQATMGVLQTGPKHFPKCKVGKAILSTVDICPRQAKARWAKMDDFQTKMWHSPSIWAMLLEAHFWETSQFPPVSIGFPWGHNQEFANSSEKCRQRCLSCGTRLISYVRSLYLSASLIFSRRVKVLSPAAYTVLSRLKVRAPSISFQTSCCELQQDGWTWDDDYDEYDELAKQSWVCSQRRRFSEPASLLSRWLLSE